MKVYLRLVETVNEENEQNIMKQFLPEMFKICSNKIRAGILHLLIYSPNTLHSMQVERLALKLGIRPRVLLFHLEKLTDWKLLEVKKNQKYGSKIKRSIWGLNLRHPNWIMECYKTIRSHFFTQEQLSEITNRNVSYR